MTTTDFWEPYRTSGKVYLPTITKARWVKRFQIGPYRAIVGTDCESTGPIHYTHILYIFKEGEDRPYLAVSSEFAYGTGEDGIRHVCLFFGGSHFNAGPSSDWADLEKFTQKALELVADVLHVTDKPQELSIS